MFFLFLKAIVIGFAISAPVGPIGLLCIQRSLRDGFKIGLITGLGAATADSIYGFIAAFGLTATSSFLAHYQWWIHFLGSLFLLLLGLRLLIKKHHYVHKKNREDNSPWHAYGTTIILTLMNPLTIFSFIAIFAGLRLGTQHRDYLHATLLVSGIFLGSTCWWVFLSSLVAKVLHHRIKQHSMLTIDRISGGMIAAFGVIALLY